LSTWKRRSAAADWAARIIQPRLSLFAAVLLTLMIGAVAGVFSVRGLNQSGYQELSLFVNQLLHNLTVQGPAPTDGWQWMAAEDVLKVAGLLWLLGLSVIGVPLIAAVVFLRGFTLGFVLGFLIDNLGLRGAALALAAMLPQNLVSIPGILFCAVGAIGFSTEIVRTVFGRARGITIYHHLRREGSVGLIGCGLLLASSVIEIFVSPTLTAVAARYLLRGV
jgi:stage II sporulation protein M